MEKFQPNWATLYAHQISEQSAVVDLEFNIVHKHQPEKTGVALRRCRLEDKSNNCKIETSKINLGAYLLKMRLECIGACVSNLTIGLT